MIQRNQGFKQGEFSTKKRGILFKEIHKKVAKSSQLRSIKAKKNQ
jgi:hypothetical protein